MLITLKNKEFLILDDFIIKCAIGKNGIKLKKKEGDKTTPSGVFSISKLYYRADRVKKPLTKIPTKIITRNMGWCDDPKSKYYNMEILINKNIKHEKLYRKDNLYNYLMVIDYNIKKIIPYKGSAIFIHLTKSYKQTAGCLAINQTDFLILAKLESKRCKLKIC